MSKGLTVAAVACLFVAAGVFAEEGQKPRARPKQKAEEKKPDPSRMFERLDKNNDGSLAKDELPERMQKAFDRIDGDKDGKISKDEFKKVADRLAGKPGPAANPDRLKAMFQRLDANNDGKIAKAEAQGPLAENFDRIDRNNDGYIDKEEAGRALERLKPDAAKPVKPPEKPRKPEPEKPRKPDADKPRSAEERPPVLSGVDFDRLDKDVDGRLTRDEAKGTALAEKFDAVDSNRDGKVDPRELEAFRKK